MVCVCVNVFFVCLFFNSFFFIKKVLFISIEHIQKERNKYVLRWFQQPSHKHTFHKIKHLKRIQGAKTIHRSLQNLSLFHSKAIQLQ